MFHSKGQRSVQSESETSAACRCERDRILRWACRSAHVNIVTCSDLTVNIRALLRCSLTVFSTRNKICSSKSKTCISVFSISYVYLSTVKWRFVLWMWKCDEGSEVACSTSVSWNHPHGYNLVVNRTVCECKVCCYPHWPSGRLTQQDKSQCSYSSHRCFYIQVPCPSLSSSTECISLRCVWDYEHRCVHRGRARDMIIRTLLFNGRTSPSSLVGMGSLMVWRNQWSYLRKINISDTESNCDVTNQVELHAVSPCVLYSQAVVHICSVNGRV